MRYALISDIHGNKPALEAVLEDIHQAGVDAIVCLGDIVNIGPFSSECLTLIRELSCPIVQGNHELYLQGEVVPEDWQTCPTWSPLRWTHSQLDDEQLAYVGDLPFSHELSANGRAAATFVHASLFDQFLGFYAGQAEDEVEQGMNGREQITLFCGHTHQQFYRQWGNSFIVNVGAVGMPLDGSPEAKYVIATRQQSSWNVEFRRVAYDVDATMRAFDNSGLQEAGGVITAVFRYQMLTGQPTAMRYLISLRHFAAERGLPVGAAYAEMPVPEFVKPFFR